MYSLIIMICGSSTGAFIREIPGFKTLDKAMDARESILNEQIARSVGHNPLTISIVAK